MVTEIETGSLGVCKGGGTHPFAQHELSSDSSSAGRAVFTEDSFSQNETTGMETRNQPEVTATTSPLGDVKHGGDRRIARHKARGTRVTVRLSDEEYGQLTRVADRYRLSESGAIRAAVDYLDGAPLPHVIGRDVLRLVAAVNAVGVNINQITRQGWSGVEPELKELREATVKLLALAKELGT